MDEEVLNLTQKWPIGQEIGPFSGPVQLLLSCCPRHRAPCGAARTSLRPSDGHYLQDS
ncbi:protein of unknown function [Paraburkholderia kururiensis]